MDLAKKTLGKEKAKEVLASLHRQITEIKRIGGFIYLSRKNPQPKVITAINDLAQKIKNELLREEKEL